MALALLGADGAQVEVADLPESLVAQEIKPHLIHQTVVAELAARRAGTHSTKTRNLVRGGGAKPWRQKGTGRARQGSIRSPQWVGGGVVFGPTPRSHGGKVNKKIREQAFRSALRAHADREGLALMDTAGWDEPSTRRAKAYLAAAPQAIASRPLLVVLDDADGAAGRSFRNLAGVYVLSAREIEVVDLMAGRSLLIERSVWERWAGEIGATTAQTAPAGVPRERKKRAPRPPRQAGPALEKPAAVAPIERTVEPEVAVAEEQTKVEAVEPDVDETDAGTTEPEAIEDPEVVAEAEAAAEAVEDAPTAADELAAESDETDEAAELAESEDEDAEEEKS